MEGSGAGPSGSNYIKTEIKTEPETDVEGGDDSPPRRDQTSQPQPGCSYAPVSPPPAAEQGKRPPSPCQDPQPAAKRQKVAAKPVSALNPVRKLFKGYCLKKMRDGVCSRQGCRFKHEDLLEKLLEKLQAAVPRPGMRWIKAYARGHGLHHFMVEFKRWRTANGI